MTDKELMLCGNEAALVELMKRHRKGVFNFIFRRIQNKETTEELVQDVFFALFQNAERYSPTAKFTTYLYAIAFNRVAKEWLRQSRRLKTVGLLDDVDKKPEPLKQREIGEAISGALLKLPDWQREVFTLHRLQGLSYDEIAENLKVPIGTVKSRIVRAEKALRLLLEDYKEYLC